MSGPGAAELLARTIGGDGAAATAMLADLVPLVPVTRRRMLRDDMLRCMADWLLSADPLGTPSRVVDLIAAAADSVARGRRLTPRSPFHRLDAGQIARLEREVLMLRSWQAMPPGKRQLFKIVTGRR